MFLQRRLDLVLSQSNGKKTGRGRVNLQFSLGLHLLRRKSKARKRKVLESSDCDFEEEPTVDVDDDCEVEDFVSENDTGDDTVLNTEPNYQNRRGGLCNNFNKMDA